MKKILLVFGTRPEAIKMAPLVLAMARRRDEVEPIVCITAQHREMLDGVLKFFGINPDFDLNIMQPGQDLYGITANIVQGMKGVLHKAKPDWVLVHGDTTTSFAAALAAYYERCRVGHVEAGLRSHNKYSPFPEEMNRRLTAAISDVHFAPTNLNRKNLQAEGIAEAAIKVTGNTVIDALFHARNKIIETGGSPLFRENGALAAALASSRPMILVTAHRRENFGEPLVQICDAIQRLVVEFPDIFIVWPIHPNPNIQNFVWNKLENISNVFLTHPQKYEDFVQLMDRSTLVMTDSGGVQEEAPSLGKPVLVLRDVTERIEALEAGTVEVIGTDSSRIFERASSHLRSKKNNCTPSFVNNPYGDGNASDRIIDWIVGKDC